MPKPKHLSGRDVVKILEGFGFHIESQRGSHIKMRRILKDGTRQAIIIPDHKELAHGTIRGIYRKAALYVPDQDLHPHFFSD